MAVERSRKIAPSSGARTARDAWKSQASSMFWSGALLVDEEERNEGGVPAVTHAAADDDARSHDRGFAFQAIRRRLEARCVACRRVSGAKRGWIYRHHPRPFRARSDREASTTSAVVPPGTKVSPSAEGISCGGEAT